jgi:hypothetical protein
MHHAFCIFFDAEPDILTKPYIPCKITNSRTEVPKVKEVFSSDRVNPTQNRYHYPQAEPNPFRKLSAA